MSRPILLLAAGFVAGCSESPDGALARYGSEIGELIWECQEEVLAGGVLLESEICRNYVEKNAALDRKFRHLEDQYQDSFEFQFRNFLGWERSDGFPCNLNCWRAQAEAGWAAARFRRLVIFSQGCNMYAYGDAYFHAERWDDLNRWQEEEPCRASQGMP